MNMKTTWNLGLIYKSPKDPQIEKDMQAIEKICSAFAKKWQHNIKYKTDSNALLRALADYEKVEDVSKEAKPMLYFYFARDIDSNNPTYNAAFTKITDRLIKAINQTLFFGLTIGRLDKKFQTQILKDVRFKNYHHFLRQLFESAKYHLSEAEEKIMLLKSGPAYQSWLDANEKSIRKLTVKWKGEILPIQKASGMISALPRKERAHMNKLVVDQYKSVSMMAESELNAIMQDKKINDELRGYKNPYDARFLECQNTEREVMQLMNAVKKFYPSAHRLFKLKAQLMGLKKLEGYDEAVSLQTVKRTFTFEQGVAIVRSAFEKVDPQYAAILDRYVANGQIDVYSRVGKQGGGYCATVHNCPTFILLNWTDDFRSVRTLAHEMGHAINGELSKKLGVLYEGCTISTAEVASTLFENFVFDELIKQLSEKDRVYALYNKLQDTFFSVFRQIAWFEAEIQMHKRFRENGAITTEELTQIRREQVKRSSGPVFNPSEEDGWGWVGHPHIRDYFYVYTYAYGNLISTAMYAKYKKDPRFISNINQFLAAGESDTPLNIFKSIGIDTSKESFWLDGLKSIDEDIKNLEKMAKKVFKKK